MKTASIISVTAATALLAVPAYSQQKKAKIPAVPAGKLVATPEVVHTGTYPTLNWNIQYPSSVGDIATIDGDGTINLTDKNIYVDVRLVGVGVTQSTPGADKDSIPAEIRISVNGSSYDQLFYGTNSDVDPTHSLYTKKHQLGTRIDFGGRYVVDGQWTPFTTTNSPAVQFTTLTDGQDAPVSSDAMAEYLKPYVNGSGKIKVGPMSALVMAEYAETDSQSSSYDNQDMVLLVNFSTKNNNGHGNNIDGVDSSNPGQGSGGPNGAEDPSGDVDDER